MVNVLNLPIFALFYKTRFWICPRISYIYFSNFDLWHSIYRKKAASFHCYLSFGLQMVISSIIILAITYVIELELSSLVSLQIPASR
jgi:hypothetical protein